MPSKEHLPTPTTFHSETPLTNRVLRELSSLGCLAWRNPTGVARSLDGQRVIRFGLRGSPDVIAIVPPLGTFLAVEIKTENDRQRPEQRAFGEAVRLRGGYYAIVRHPDEVGALVDQIKAERSSRG